ncbi:arabinose efflux permease family protein [Desulfosporosinus acidiphilus SJ4]|uniref:Arabinose efflux permease family protein n=1 Tax=Desulfosporosinus acidiphilus (strain DSM 22704 / JCM 16185 / SJ4) TaxID=646529 RepID=I4D6E8_DESAJ|nr:tetracycline resistance MFS efflux pump [Desulfosporosinus acidiphilus]AFM41372.1 arabinose efflux permease family protein [Desulfosporosinus acidiphilus SJ4]
MSRFKLINTQPIEQIVNRNALIFGLISVLLYGIGFGLTTPVVPFLVQPFFKNAGNQAMAVALLTFIYAICVFLAAPALGALSDRYGRRPILLVCLLGSAAGYLIFGIGGALWVLFLGRIIDGLTGGNISTILAYFADITPADQRTKYFGWAGAAAGAGTIIGPSLGGLLANFGYSTPVYFGAIITLLNVVYGAFYMPESLCQDRRLKKISFARLNPLTQLASILSIKNLKWIFIAIFLLGVPSGSLQALFSQLAKDTFKWGPWIIGVMFSILGALDIITQSLLMPKLLIKLKVSQIAVLGMLSETIAYGLIAVSVIFSSFPFFIAGTIVYGFGDAIFGPSVNGILSSAVSSEEQGRIQGGSQSVQALTRIIGPILGGELYVSLGHFAPAVMGIILVTAAVTAIQKGTHNQLWVQD